MAYDAELADHVRSLLEGGADISERPMFGGLAFLVRGNMAVAVSSQGGLLIRAAAERCDTLVSSGKATFMEMRGRPMRGWLRVTDAARSSDDEVERWVDLGTSYARSLPPKD